MTTKDEQARLADLLDLAASVEAEEMDPNDVAGLAAGRPGAEVRLALEARLVQAPPEDRRLVADIAGAVPAGPRAQAGRPRWRLLAVAALVLLAIGAGWTILRPEGTSDAPARTLAGTSFDDTTLAMAFSSLRHEAPDAFEGIEPLLAKERGGASTLTRSGGIRVHAPVGALLRADDPVRWEAVPGASAYDVRVLSDEGDEVLRLTHVGTSLPWPLGVVLKQGTAYVVAVSTVAGGIRRRGSSAFHLLSRAEATRYAAALHAIADAQPVALRPVLRAHVAIRQGLLPQARAHLEQGGQGDAAHALLAQTRAYLDRAQGRE